MSEPAEPRPTSGFVEPSVQDEFPGLRLDWVATPARRRASPPALVGHLKALSSRYRGADVVAMRTKPIPHAYRVFFRHIGLDPDIIRIPNERAAVARLLHGGFRSAGLIEDVCLVALVETGVPVWALDADAVDDRGLGIRTATTADLPAAAETGLALSAGSLVVADRRTVHAPLFGDLPPTREVREQTRQVVLFAVGVDGVPAIHVEESLWTCLQLLR